MADSRAKTVPANTSTLDLHQLPEDRAVYSCQKCSEVIVRLHDSDRRVAHEQALQDELVSNAFNGQSGRAL